MGFAAFVFGPLVPGCEHRPARRWQMAEGGLSRNLRTLRQVRL
jgi:hypothetical protein